MARTDPERAFARGLAHAVLASRSGRKPSAARLQALLAAPVPWERWRDAFNKLHHAEPGTEARLAGLLAQAARRPAQRTLRARFTVLQGRGLLRVGAPGDAGDTLVRAARLLEDVGERSRAAQALVTAVDAFAHAGRIQHALALARRVAPRLRGADLEPWRDFLAANRAGALRLRGDLEEAEREFERTARRLATRGDAVSATIARMNAAVARLEAGRPEAARVAFVQAERALEAQGRSDMAREARYNVACADVRLGRLGVGVRALEGLAQAYDAAGNHRRSGLARMDLAAALLRAGDPVQAEEEARRAAGGFEQARSYGEAAEARWLVAAALAPRDVPAARRALRRARGLAQRHGRRAVVLRCRLLEADLRFGTGLAISRASLAGLELAARRDGQVELARQVGLLRGARLLRAGRARLALRQLARSTRSPAPAWLRAAELTLAAEAQRRLGRGASALRLLERACALLEPAFLDLPGGWLRATFLLQHLDPWLARVDLLLQRGGERNRRAAVELLDRLSGRRFTAWARSQPLDPRQARLRSRLESLYDRLARGAGPTRGAGSEELRALLGEVERLEQRLSALLQRAERSLPVGDRQRPPRGARSGTRARAATLHLWRRGSEAWAAFSTADGEVTVRPLGQVDTLVTMADRLAFHARRARLTSSERLREGPAREALHAALAAMGHHLLAVLESPGLPKRLSLCVDPRLPDLPLESLPLHGRPLCDATQVVRVPAVGFVPRARRRGRGVSWLAAGEADLPGVMREGRTLRAAELIVGPQATIVALRAALLRCSRVHVAGHGFDAKACPALGGVRLADGWFGAADLPASVAADVVVLAACRTGRVRGPGALGWGGLPTALLAVGARYVVWTADDVDDAATAAFVARFDAALRSGEDVPLAFGRALAAGARTARGTAALLPFRLSGIPA